GARARRAPAAGASKRPPGLKRFTLSDGSTLLVKRRPQVPLVSFGAFFGGGFRDEKDAQAGVTSLMTKCLLKGTERLSYADLSRSVEGLAAHIDPVLEKDYWGLTGECLSGRLDETFALFRETLLSPAFRREEVAKEKQMQLAALRRLKDDPADYALLKSDVLTFAGTPYAHPPQGTSGSVSRLSRPEVLAWYGRFLASRNLTWVAVGDVEEERMRRLVEDAARGIPRGKRAPSPRPSGRGAALRSYREKNKGQQANLVLGFRAPHFSHPDYFAFRVMNTLLNGMGGRLFVELREKKSLAYSVYAAHEALAAAGIYQVYIGCAPEKQAQAREGLGRVLADLAAGPIPAEELERAKTYLVGLYQVGQQANRSQLATLARYEMEGLGAEVVQDFPQRVGRVSAGQVRRAAGKYLKMAEANWVVLEPRTRH
ncbi:MAG TPA: pitrilysin family protein, partial [bacterium]|nr:pitrilysin family protein [bacterium]